MGRARGEGVRGRRAERARGEGAWGGRAGRARGEGARVGRLWPLTSLLSASAGCYVFLVICLPGASPWAYLKDLQRAPEIL